MTLTKVVLSERDMPTHWYNINADLPAAGVELPPVLHPITLQPVGLADLAPLFPMALIMQEVSTERYIEIPDQVQDLYKLWRPTPLYRAVRWEEALDTPAKIYFKYEGTSPAGSHRRRLERASTSISRFTALPACQSPAVVTSAVWGMMFSMKWQVPSGWSSTALTVSEMPSTVTEPFGAI